MHDTNLAAVDLNLLVALDALLEERSVTRAARRLGLSQPATSHALARLRELAGDPLLVRSGARLVATPRADALAAPVRAILDDIRRTLAGDAFEPKTARRTFTIATADYAELVLLPALLCFVAREAPGIDLVLRPVPDDTAEALASGRIDVALGVERSLDGAASLSRRRLFGDGFSCLVRRDHPVLRSGLTLDRFVAMGHVFIAPGGTRGGVVDDALTKRGLTRRVAVMVPSFLGAPALVAGSDLVVTLPSLLAARLAEPFGLRVVEPPLPLPRFTLSAIWHARSSADPAHAWLRTTIAEVTRDLRDAPPPATPRRSAPRSRRR